MRADLEFIATALGDAVESSRYSIRLAHGSRLRTALYRAMAAGQQVNHYRLQWLGASAARLVAAARQMCKDFDTEHPDDMASAFDLGDILRIASAHINDSLPQEVVAQPDAPSEPPGETPPT
jgi:hypothetical protein